MQSLERIYRQEDRSIGINEKNSGAPQKMVRSAFTGKTVVVPGYEEDFVFQNDLKKKDFDVSKQVSSNWNWERYNNIIIHKVDRVAPAVPDFERIPRQIKEV